MTGANAKIKRIYVGDKQVRPVWKPGSNTVAYFPLQSDGLDVMGNYTLTSTGTEQTIGRLFTSDAITSSKPTGVNTCLVWAKINTIDSPVNGKYVQLMRCTIWNVNFQVSSGRTDSPSFYTYTNAGHVSGVGIVTTGNWYLIAITRSKSGSTTTVNGYINGTEYPLTSYNFSQDTPDNIYGLINSGGGGTVNMVLSKFIMESKTWTQAEIQEYYNLTKSNYGL